MIDWIGYYCDDTARCQLNIPTTSISSLRHDHNDTPPPSSSPPSSSPSFYSSSKVLQEILDPLPIFHSVENYYCCIGDQDVIPALEMGLRFMNVHSTIIPSSNTNNMNENDDIENNNNIDKNIDSSDLHNNNSVTISDTIQPPLAIALIYSHSKYAYGLSSRTYTYTTSSTTSASTDRPIATTTYTLPPLSNVIYKVTLKRILPSVTASNTNDPKVLLQLYQCKKLLANDIYQNDIQMTPKKKKNGNGNGSTTNDDTTIADESKHDTNSTNNTYHVHRAIRIYQRTVEQLENFMIELQQQLQLQSSSPNDTTTLSYITEARQLQLDCLNNISAVYMKCHYYHKAKEACVQTLLKDSNNSKALFRAAKAALYDPASSYDEVQATLRAVQDLVRTTSDTTNTNNNTRTLQRDLELLQKEYHQHEMKYKQQQKVMAARIQQKMKHTTTSSTTKTTTAWHDSESNTATLQNHNDNKNNVSPDINHQTSTHTNDHTNNYTILQSILSSFHSTPTLSNNTKQILYRILQVILLLFLLLYMYIYFHVLNVTVTTTTTTIPSQEL